MIGPKLKLSDLHAKPKSKLPEWKRLNGVTTYESKGIDPEPWMAWRHGFLKLREEYSHAELEEKGWLACGVDERDAIKKLWAKKPEPMT